MQIGSQMKQVYGVILFIFGFFSPASQALTLNGELTQGSLVRGSVSVGSKIDVDGRSVRVSESGEFVVGFSRDAKLTQKLTEMPVSGDPIVHTIQLQKRDYNIQRINGISKKIMSPSSASLKRIRDEAALVKKARKDDKVRLEVFGNFIWPLDGPVTGVYGSQRVYNGKPGRPHYGLDIAAPTGTPVRAPAGGVVVLAHDDMFYSGGTLILDHGHGVFSTFIHMHKVLADVGQEIKQGDVIGQVGATGRATGPHLDWRMNWFGVRVDPRLLLPNANPTAKKK